MSWLSALRRIVNFLADRDNLCFLHIQRVLVEAAKLHTRESHELPSIRAKGLEGGDPHQGHARGCHEDSLLHTGGQRSQQDFAPAEEFTSTEWTAERKACRHLRASEILISGLLRTSQTAHPDRSLAPDGALAMGNG